MKPTFFFFKVRDIIKEYPLPLFVLCGLFSGILARWGFQAAQVAQILWYLTLLIGGFPIILQTIKGMLKGKFASDIVAMLAIVTAILMEQAFAGAIVVLMQSGGEAIEAYGLKRASSSLDALLARAPRMAWRKQGQTLEEIEVGKVCVGDVLIVRPGDLIPVDGTILQGDAEIDESAITGEPLAKNKGVGRSVLSGSIAVNGAFEMQADRVSQESQYAKMVLLVKKAQEEKAPIQRLADRYALFFTPLALLMSGLGFALTRDPTTILAVLVVATPCPLILATPIAVISGINRAAQEGIIVKGGAPIEQIGRAKAILFDKTGTITFGTPHLKEVLPLNGTSSDDLLFKTALLAQLSSHAVARSVAKRALEKFKALPLPENFKEYPGRGMEGDFKGEHLAVGSRAFLTQLFGEGFFKDYLPQKEEREMLATFVSVEGRFSGVILFSDHLRPGVSEMVRRLETLGITYMAMLTGDSAKNANSIAKEAGVAHVHADLLPEQKVQIVQSINKKHHTTIMVGDGINDAPALATASVGVAMGAHGTGISAEAADIVLLVDDVTKVADAVEIGQRMLFIAKQGIFIGMGLSFLLMIAAAFGEIPPAVGALLQEIIDAAVILNALRAR